MKHAIIPLYCNCGPPERLMEGGAEMSYILEPIGALRASGGKCRIELDKKYAPALEGLEGFSHINILWWFYGCDDAVSRSALTARPPCALKGPRSPPRRGRRRRFTTASMSRPAARSTPALTEKPLSRAQRGRRTARD